MSTLAEIAAKIELATRPGAPEAPQVGGSFDLIEADLETPADAPAVDDKYAKQNNVIFVNVEGEIMADLKRAIVDASEAANLKPSQWIRQTVAEKLNIVIPEAASKAAPKKIKAHFTDIDEGLLKACVFAAHMGMLYGENSPEHKDELRAVAAKVKRLADGTKNKDGSTKTDGIGKEAAETMLARAQEKAALVSARVPAPAA